MILLHKSLDICMILVLTMLRRTCLFVYLFIVKAIHQNRVADAIS